MCSDTVESIDDLFLSCRCAQMLWKSILNLFDCSGPLPSTLVQVYEALKLSVGFPRGRIMQKVSFVAIIWTIWKERNS